MSLQFRDRDFELDIRKERRDRAWRALQEARSNLEHARSHRDIIRSMYGPKLDYLKSAIPSKKDTMRYYFEQASASHERHEWTAAGDWSRQGHQLRDEIQGMYAEKEECYAQINAANAAYGQAAEAYQELKQEFEAARESVNERYAYLKEQNERRRQERETERQRNQKQRPLLGPGKQFKQIGPGPNELSTEATWEDGKPAWREVWSHTPWRSDTFYGGAGGHPIGRGHEHGHVVRINGEIVYKRRPGQTKPDIDIRRDLPDLS